jgi:zinc protease
MIFTFLVSKPNSFLIFVSVALLLFGSNSWTSEKNPQQTSVTQNESRKEKVPLTEKLQVIRYTLKNGLRLLVIEDHSSPTFAYQTWYKVGSRNEKKGQTGLAHLFEHMMFKETKTLKEGEFDRLLESSGAEGENAFTSRDFTAYIQELPKGNLELIAKAEADRMVNLVINEKAFKTETEVVQNERRFRNENNPDGLMDQELFNKAFAKHPYHWPVIGYQEDLNRMSVQNALDFYRSYYSPNHATVIVVGDVKSDEVYSIVEKYYGGLPSQAAPTDSVPKEPPQKAPRTETLRLNIQVEKLLLGYPVPGFKSEDLPAMDVLQTILSTGKSSRLSRALVDTGIATSVDSYVFENKDPSLFIIMTNLQKKKRATQAETTILRELNRLSKELVTQEELDRAKNKMTFRFFGGLESNFEKAYFLGHYETIAGNFMHGIEHQKKAQAVKAKDVQRVAQKYLNPKHRTVIVGVPK